MTRARPEQAAPPRTAAGVMIRRPKTLPVDATVGQARAELSDAHVHMLLLVAHDRLHGTIVRGDLADDCAPGAAALDHARLDGRTVGPDVSADTIRCDLVAAGRRRLAVVTDTGALLGLVCLKRDRTGFCTDEGVARRAAGHENPC